MMHSILKGIPHTFREGAYKSLIMRLLIILSLFSVSRILFLIFNINSFPGINFSLFLRITLAGLRFDIATILILNLPVIFINILPFTLKNHFILQKFGNLWFFIVNGFAILANTADMIYFRFSNTRSTAEIFRFLGTGNDFIRSLPSYLTDFWFVPLIGGAMIYIMIVAFRKVGNSPRSQQSPSFSSYLMRHLLWFSLLLFLTITGCRGGLQLRPITMVTAGKYAGAQYSVLITNTPFSIIKTYGKEGLKPVDYFDDKAQLNELFNPCHSYSIKHKDTTFNNQNVVIIILESFSSEYSALLNPSVYDQVNDGYTPFLDSLMQQSILFENAYANASRSIDAIPAIISSIPNLMNESYILSSYGGSNCHSLPHELSAKGYVSMFFHGGTNGTMGFDDYARVAGFDHYYGKDEFDDDTHFDGRWGIFDEEFLQYMATTLNQQTQPFFATAFTLSSHHPYTIPERYESVFAAGALPIHRSVRYSDHALRQFFKTAAKMPWFENTLFVITADHTSEAMTAEGRTPVGKFKVPLFLYHNKLHEGTRNQKVAQHTDIMPTILDHLHYNKDFIAFGGSLLEPDYQGQAVHFRDNIYQFTNNKYVLFFDGKTAISLYDYKNDPLLQHNIIEKHPEVASELGQRLKAYIQEFNNRMMSNQLVIK